RQNVETGVKPIRHPVPGPLSVFNILKTERHEPVAYTEKRTLPSQFFEAVFARD
ncbi:MAG: hypothetical protein ACJAU6_002293, partial [Alphaproteobacteria bacterium]